MTSAKIGAIAPVVKRQGSVLKPELLDKLVHLRIERATGLVGRATLRFSDNGFGLSASDTFALGTAVSISEPDAGVLLEGTVTGIRLEQSARTLPELVVVIDDAGYKLTRGTSLSTYLNGRYSDVLSKMAQRHGLRPKIDAGRLTMSYLLQAGTDLAYLNAVTERTGLVWYVDDGPSLVVTKPELGTPAATLTLGENLREFSVRASGLRPTSVRVHGWDPDQQAEVLQESNAASWSGAPALAQPFLGDGPQRKLSAAVASVADVRAMTTDEGKELASARYQDWASAAVVARGRAEVDSAIKPGATVKLADAGPASGNYLVTAVEHLYDRGGFTTTFVAGPYRPAQLVDTLGPAAPSPGLAVSGLVVGVVSDCNDPDEAGRVKVRYTGVQGDVESPWARVVALGGGPDRGAVFQPEVRDEVLVGFEHGDTRRPVVIGGLYSKRNALPTDSKKSKYVADGQVNYRRITSRKKHTIEFADGTDPATQHILLVTGTAAHKLRLGADRFDIEVAQGKELTIKAGNAKFDINASGDVTIEGNNITIKAKLALELQGGTTAAVKGTTQTTVQGAQLQVKADGMASVEASGPLTLKGAVVGIN